VATVDRYGCVKIVDRTKDLVKSGGEWISSVQLENAIMSHPKVVEAAVIGVPHPQWVERPLACVVVEPGETLTAAELRAYLEQLVPRWWLPPSSRGEFHPPALTDPYVNLSVHTALVVLVTRLWGRSCSRPSARSTVVVL
jgi:hypothetical protein